MSYVFTDNDSFKSISDIISSIHEELRKIRLNESYKPQDTRTELHEELPKNKPEKVKITHQEAVDALKIINIEELELEIKRWHIVMEMCGIYNVASKKEHMCTISCRNMDTLQQIFNVEDLTTATDQPTKSRLFKLPKIMYIWDAKYTNVIQKMLQLSYLQNADYSKSFIFSLSEKHHLYGCFSSGRMHFCHPISSLRHDTCSNTIVIDTKSGSASCGFSGLSIPNMDDKYVADKNLSFTETFNNGLFKPGFYNRKEVPIFHKEPRDSKPNPTKRKLFTSDKAEESANSSDKGFYIHNLGPNIKFKYDNVHSLEKINGDLYKYYVCLKNTCLVIYWYRTCIINDTYNLFNSKLFDDSYEKYWTYIRVMFPKIYNMYQSYIHAHNTSSKKSVSRKCNLASLLMGLCGLLAEGLVVYQTQVIEPMDVAELCFNASDVEKLGWDKDYITEQYTQKYLDIEKKPDCNDGYESPEDEDASNIQDNNRVNLLKKSYQLMLDSLVILSKNKKYNQYTLFCDVVTNKSGGFSYITAYNNGTKTITDICHECDMDPKTMKQLLYFQ